MSLKAFQHVNTEDQQLERVQQNIAAAVNPVIQASIIDGRLIKDVSLTTAQANLIEHKLGRALKGWFITRLRAGVTIWDEQDSNELPSRTLDLRSSADVVVDVWVF